MISGLDPAQPLFYTGPQTTQLHRDDASFVEVLHTEIGLLGKPESLGHVDVYVNGGKNQATCHPYMCSYSKAYEIYADAGLPGRCVGMYFSQRHY